MRNIFAAVLFSIVFAGVSLAQARIEKPVGSRVETGRAKIAVFVCPSEPRVSTIGPAEMEKLQSGIVASLRQMGKFDIVDAGRTSRTITAVNLAGNTPNGVAQAARFGKLLGVNYVLVAEVTGDGQTSGGYEFTVVARITEVSTGRIVAVNTYRGTTTVNDGAMRQGGSNTWTGNIKLDTNSTIGNAASPAVFEKVMKPVIQQLTASLKAADL